ncbi:Hsp20/alpha crystallin family protein [Candidatus Hecatella orcuttiae]|jgi:HSP20 family molecular chaperone IbpA|uniref:Hsp20/alpha crystallin family protein n=1 Tax=Candidatus Hecatella orcuttiae TaxID=1935119 RepID=UPI002867CD3E|nr:Hsp20/alpha crystallin family protein [Candidatus Hecatella orcuttiae]
MSTRKRRSFFDLFDEIRSEIDRMMKEFTEAMLPETPMYDVTKKELQPLTNIQETEENVIVTIDLPCVRKEDIKLHITKDSLKVEAPTRQCIQFEPWGPFQRQVEFEVFRKILKLPTTVEAKKARARFQGGILEVTIPKKTVGFEVPIE